MKICHMKNIKASALGLNPTNISTLFQRCLLVDAQISNKRWNNIEYCNVGIYNIDRCQINVAYFKVVMKNVRKCQKNVVIFNVQFNNVGNRQNNVVKMTISKKNNNNNNNKKIISNWIHWIQSFHYYFKILFTSLPMLRGIYQRVLAKPWKFLKDQIMKNTMFQELQFVKYPLVFNFTRGLLQVHYD